MVELVEMVEMGCEIVVLIWDEIEFAVAVAVVRRFWEGGRKLNLKELQKLMLLRTPQTVSSLLKSLLSVTKPQFPPSSPSPSSTRHPQSYSHPRSSASYPRFSVP